MLRPAIEPGLHHGVDQGKADDKENAAPDSRPLAWVGANARPRREPQQNQRRRQILGREVSHGIQNGKNAGWRDDSHQSTAPTAAIAI